jgi:guanylate kinase
MTQQPSPSGPVIITGPSGVGKSTLIKKLLSTHPEAFARCTSHTTRAPRPGEVHYHFVNVTRFKTLIAQGHFLEWTVSSNGDYYGTSNVTVLGAMNKGKTPVLDIEVEGVKQMEANGMPWRYVFVKPPTLEALEMRLRKSGTEEDVQEALERARIEMDYAEEEKIFDRVIVNDELDGAYKELEEFLC